MKKLFMAALLFGASATIFGQTIAEFNNVVDFSYTFKDLYEAAAKGDLAALPKDFLVINGAVAGRQVIDGNRAKYLAELDLVNGEWIGVEKALRFECIIQLVGPEFAAAVPARRTRTVSPQEIQLNTRILVVAKVTGLRKKETGETIPVLRAYYVRTLH